MDVTICYSSYHPESNGLAERFVRTIKEQLRRITVNYTKTLQRLLLCYRNLPHSSTGYSPAELMFNRKLRTTHTVLSKPQEVWIKKPLEKAFEPATVVGDLGKTMKLIRKPDGTVTKRHKDQIKFNPTMYCASQEQTVETLPRRSKRHRKKPNRYGLH